MPNYLLHMTADGTPAGIYSDTYDYYDPRFEQLRPAGQRIVASRPPATPWETFIDRAARTTPSNTMRWTSYYDASSNLSIAFRHAQRDLIQEGYPEPE